MNERIDTRSVTSADGTSIGFEARGAGFVMIAVHGGTADRSRWAAVSTLLERHFTVWAVDRRGRGLSGDAASYGIEREAEDLVALALEAGPGAVMLAHSYGATCALAAAPHLSDLGALVLYEPALPTPGHDVVDKESMSKVERLLERGARDEALTFFFQRLLGLPDAAIDAMRPTPVWAARLAAVHTLPREGWAAQAFRIERAGLDRLPYPVLVMRGSDSPAWLRSAAAAVHGAVPGSQLIELDGQAHMAMDTAPEAFAADVVDFVTQHAGQPADR